MNEHESLSNQLENLAEQSQPDSQFIDNLENHLRLTHLKMQSEKAGKLTMISRFFNQSEYKSKKRKRKPSSSMRWLAAIFAFVIIGGLFLTVRPMRKTAQSVMDYFFPPEVNFFDVDYQYQRTMNTLSETEPLALIKSYNIEKFTEVRTIYPDEFLVFPEQDDIKLSYIMATGETIMSLYHVIATEELGTGYPSVISLYQLPAELFIPLSIPPEDFNQKVVRINGFAGAYIQSSEWLFPLPTSRTSQQSGASYRPIGNAHRLVWQDDDVVYILTMTEYLADTVEDVVAVAESLVPYTPEANP